MGLRHDGQPPVRPGGGEVMPTNDDYKAMAVLSWDYSPFELADHLADVLPFEEIRGRRIWGLPAQDLALLAHLFYPGGAQGLQLDLMGE